MTIQRRMSQTAAAAVGVTAILAVTGCTAPGSDSSATPVAVTDEITAPVTAEQVAELGDITLSVWADQGEQDFMEVFVPTYEDMYPNVTVDIQYKSYNDLVATVINAMNSADAPDVTQGNQGWATDGALVKAGLIRPLDDAAAAYGYEAAAGDAISQLMWSDDGSQFGSGTIFGMSPDNQMVGIFYNKSRLDALGLEVPRTLSDLEAALKTAHDAGDTPLVLGNSDKASAMQTLSILQGALTDPAQTRGWILGEAGSDITVASNVEAVDTLARWVAEGYVSPGYDGTSPDDAAAAFAAGDGVFFIGGNWYAGTISDGETFGFSSGLDDGGNASSGSFGLNWHVGAKSDATMAGLAFVGLINAAETAPMLASVNRVPIHPVSAGEPGTIFPDLLTASEEQLSGDGALYWYDWATDTMFDTFTSGLQQVLAGRQSSADMLAAVQADWDTFQADR
ncbi:ABC transporter substrate-binding protein [Microbacterium sp.]|uniref:ABC transporter substrate-binding protein n=1 Tax=Microbacterium sp. TaxID=51671 RepID=UPI003A840F94